MFAVCTQQNIASRTGPEGSGALLANAGRRPLSAPRGLDDGSAGEGGIANAPLGALEGSELEGAFHAWIGRSRKRYIFTIASPHALDREALRDAVIVCAVRAEGGRRRALFVGMVEDLEPHVRRFGAAVEIHYHLLATTAEARCAIIGDLRGAA